MKQLILALALCLSLTACAATPTEEVKTDLTTAQIAQAVRESQPDSGALSALTEDQVFDHLTLAWGLEESWTEAAVYTASGMDGQEIAVLLLAEGVDIAAAAETLETYRQGRQGDFYGYAPDQAALLENAKILSQGRYLALLACGDVAVAQAALESALAGDWTPGHTPAPTQEPTLGPDVAAVMANFPPFNPPNKTDMTRYDLAPLVEAWWAEDPSTLTEKDRAVYDVCRTAFGELLNPEMTDFEKELVLHDWLLAQGEYDQESYDTPDHVGRPDNRNPYGMLVKGYGICLGFAQTFELLMRLADVECVTVVGASADSTGDHAWNMVRLDGEWYCVDPTWNDTDPGALSGQQAQKLAHRYFNITSQMMRESNHQWDYANIPESTATAYRWNGVDFRQGWA